MNDKQGQSSDASSIYNKENFHTIDEFRQSQWDNYNNTNRFPWRPGLNIMLILLTTIQIYLIVNSRVYLRGELIRSFLSVYLDGDIYSDMFAGLAFYVKIQDIQELSDQLVFTFDRINKIGEDSFIDIEYKQSNMNLHVEYKEQRKSKAQKTVFPIDPEVGIVKPFNMHNITQIQLFLLEVERFHLSVDNLTVKENWEGFTDKYKHQIVYSYANSIQIQVNFLFSIDNALVDDQDQLQMIKETQKDTTIYIIKMRIFFAVIIILAVVSLYLNYLTIRRTYQILYKVLGQTAGKPTQVYGENEEQEQIARRQVIKWVKVNKMTMAKMKIQHYFHILQFDVVFSTLSNIFQIVSGFYLISGIQKERLAGIACMFSWLTIFKFIRQYKKLVLMYELIKMSILKVINFFVEFFPVFLAYALLGLCLFPKVSFFSSMSDSVTTLVCLMMGDSIEMITRAITQKNSTFLAILYIFSYVLLFMHAIHNTLTSLIKEFFLLKKIELVLEQKQKNNDSQYIYIEEMKSRTDKAKDSLPLKLTTQLQMFLIRSSNQKIATQFIELYQPMKNTLESIQYEDQYLETHENLRKYWNQELKRRLTKYKEVINEIRGQNIEIEEEKGKKQIKGSLLTENQ